MRCCGEFVSNKLQLTLQLVECAGSAFEVIHHCSSEARMSTLNCQNYILNTEPFRTRVLHAISQGQKNKQIGEKRHN